MPVLPQDLIHKIEAAISGRFARILLAVMAALTLIAAYDWRLARNFATQEAMDSAQLARNILEGKGYTTLFIRPFSMFLIKSANQDRITSLSSEEAADLNRVKGSHPDISNPPLYPTLLAGWMKVMPFHFDITKKAAGEFSRYQPDFLITALNQLFFILLVVSTFFLARKLFDAPVAWLSALLLLGTEVLWRFSASGLSTMFLLLLFMGLVWALVRFETATADSAATTKRVLANALVIGLLLGAGMLTRYAFGVLFIPVLVYVLVFAGRWRAMGALVIFGTFAAVVTPWIVRNMSVCDMPFGTATYAVLDGSPFFPQHRLDRSLAPSFTQIFLSPLWGKFFGNLGQITINELPKLGWVSGFFLVGLMFGFRSPGITRLRYFTVASLVMLIIAQSAGRTALSDDSPEINSENLLVLLLPLVLVYGVSFFFTLLDQVTAPLGLIRAGSIVLFGLLMTLPLTLTFIPWKVSQTSLSSPVVFPPYYPPDIQRVSNWMGTNELIMSDAPWAVAWYGNRQSVWLTLDTQREFYTLNDYVKPVKALYLTPISLDAKFLSQWVRGGTDRSWGELIISSMIKEELPRGFPLVKSKRLPEQLFLTDWERWFKPEEETPVKP